MTRFQSACHWYTFFIVLCCALTATPAHSQEVDIRGGFLEDSIKIGKETPFYLSARYPAELTVVFPDSTADFTPFEFADKRWFPTRTGGGISSDSAVYYLTTFEIDRIQTLKLPVFVIRNGDSTPFFSTPDTILITQLVREVPDTVGIEALPLREQTAYTDVNYAFNFWLMVIIVAVVIAVIVTVWLLLGKKFLRWLAMRRLRKQHAAFLHSYEQLVGQAGSALSTPATESALATWKRYMEKLDSRPYTKLTTRELLKMIGDKTLSDHLGQIDRAIYGHAEQVVDSLQTLKQYAIQTFERKLKEVQHG